MSKKYSLDQWIFLFGVEQFREWAATHPPQEPFPGISSAQMVPEMYRRGLIPRVFNCAGKSRDVVRQHLKVLARSQQLISSYDKDGEPVYLPTMRAKQIYEQLKGSRMLEYALSKQGVQNLTEMLLWVSYFLITPPRVVSESDLALCCAAPQERITLAMSRLSKGVTLPSGQTIRMDTKVTGGFVRLANARSSDLDSIETSETPASSVSSAPVSSEPAIQVSLEPAIQVSSKPTTPVSSEPAIQVSSEIPAGSSTFTDKEPEPESGRIEVPEFDFGVCVEPTPPNLQLSDSHWEWLQREAAVHGVSPQEMLGFVLHKAIQFKELRDDFLSKILRF